jgi:flavin-dependent dehydrogenase
MPVEGAGWDLEIACSDKRLECRCGFIVDATGRESAVALKQGAKRIYYDHLIGVVGYFSPNSQETFDGNYMLLEAVEDGWWYSATLPDLRLVVAYMTDADMYSAGIKTSATHFLDQLRRAPHTRSRATSHALKSDVRVLSANSYRIDRITGRNWLAVGDAATAFDPLSSQGVYKALKSGLRAAQRIEDYLAGEETALLDYSSWVNESFDRYLLLRKEYYSREGRWPSSEFWQRRH